jgi:predicted TIM-barrel fold metal-dependent hydrolase
MLIDFHTHIVPPRVKLNRDRYTSDPLFRLLYGSSRAKLATVEDLVADMDKHGVDMSVILNIGWSSAALCAETNDYIMESVVRFPGRLAGFGTVQLGSGDAAFREVERCAKGAMKGIGEIRLDRREVEWEGPSLMDEFASTLAANGLILLVHSSEPVGHDYTGKGDTTPDVLYKLVTRYKQLKVVAAHWGGGLPFYALMPEVKAVLNNVLFDTAASPLLYTPLIYRQVIDIIGAGRVLFGSDYPLVRPGRLVREIRSLNLPVETEYLIMEGNARRLLGLG